MNFGARSAEERRARSVGSAPAEATLACGHVAKNGPIVTSPSGYYWYTCPKGCGLQKAARKKR